MAEICRAPGVEYHHDTDQLNVRGWRVVEEDVPRSALMAKDGIRVSIEVVPVEGMTLGSVADDSPYD